MARKTSTHKIPGWLWLVTGVILGVFVTFLIRLSDLKPPKTTVHSLNSEPPKSDSKKKAPTQYDFYKVLKEADMQEAASPSNRKPQNTLPEESVEFLLQVAAFKSIQDADHVKAELTLQNMKARIEVSEISAGLQWYRVVVGPFKSADDMNKVKTLLNQQKYQPLVLKRKI